VQVRTLTRAVSAVLLGAATLLPAVPAAAVPLPSNTTTDGEWWFTSLRIPDVWAMGAQGQGVTVAVLDSGVNPAVAGLSSVLLPGTNATGGGGDGRSDRNGHGTGMAAFIAGQGGAGNEIGIAPQARILPVMVDGGSLPSETVFANGIRWAAAHGAKIINISEGNPTPCPDQVQQAVVRAVSQGAIVVAAAGNDGNAGNPSAYPANCKGVVAVGAIDAFMNAWPNSERQNYVDVAAPGVHLRAVDHTGAVGHSNGTSDAAALTSASLALIWSKLPLLTNRQVVARMLAGVIDDVTTPGRDNVTGYGIVRPYHGIADNVPADAPNPIFDELAQLPGAPAGTVPPASPGSGPVPGGGQRASSERGGGISLPVALGIGGAAVLLLIVVVTALAARRRRTPRGPGEWPPGGPTPPGGGQAWPPNGSPPAGSQGWQPSRPPLGGDPGWTSRPGAGPQSGSPPAGGAPPG
jgi:hypothetical protein